MLFISLHRFRMKPTKESLAESSRVGEVAKKEGVKLLGVYWTLGRYDSVAVWEAKDERTMMKALLRWGDMLSTETLVMVPREEALKLLG